MENKKQDEKIVGYTELSTDYAQTTSKNVLKTAIAVVGLGGILLGSVASAKGVDSIDKVVGGTDSNSPIIQKVTDDTTYKTGCYPCFPCGPDNPCRPTCAPY